MNNTDKPMHAKDMTIELMPAGKRLLRIGDTLLAVLGSLAAAWVVFVATRQDTELSEPTSFLLWGGVAIYGAQVLLLAVLYTYVVSKGTPVAKASHVATSKKAVLTKTALPYSFIIIWVLLGWGISQQGTVEEGIIWAAIFVPIFLGLLGFLAGAISFLLGFLPLKFFILSIKELFTKPSWTGAAGIMGSLAVLGIASTIVLLPIAVDTDRSGTPAQGALIMAALGLPGRYSIDDPLIHVITVGIVWASLFIFVIIGSVNAVRKKRRLREKQDA